MILANTYRPKSWAEVVGQPAVVSVLSRQIATLTWKNTYLFAGAYGCGKTTVARIFANEINKGLGEPIEIDAASNNGIDSIRALIADAQQSSIDCAYKVYIIDECHQLTKAAWDAALKLIEEPPLSSIFIFCTTNPSKLPDTILSRVQRFDFKRVPNNIIADRLEFILNEENLIDFDRSALDRIAATSDGHVRNAIQNLDKCLSVCEGKLTESIVESILGLSKMEHIFEFHKAIITGNINEAINLLDQAKSSNSDLIKFFDDVIDFTIDCAIYAKTGDITIVSISKDNESRIIKDVDKLNKLINRLINYRRFADKNNSEALLKTVILEFAED